ncbi:MAG: C25 family cysteine peptidase, partial [Candidatus Latescibacterota bacterium]
RFGPPLSTRVVDIQDLYDAFSGGLVDPAALRNFIAWAYREWEAPPFFVLLLGDAVYDYKNNSGASPGNWVPAYQDGESTYDEWYVGVEGDDVFPDLAIGRLPVQTAGEAERVVDKLIGYDRQVEAGPWQSRILLIADDLYNPAEQGLREAEFLLDAEYLASSLLPQDLDLSKLYLAQYPREGTGKPRARAEFLRRLNEGALVVTFLGHGNPDVLAHELMFVLSRDLGSIANGGRLPFFYTAASQVGVFDRLEGDSMPEALLKLDGGGVIGMISATRVGYHPSNMALANLFYLQMYRTDRQDVPVGQALLEAKRLVQVPEGESGRRNVQRYSLFGDPAMRLARPRARIVLAVAETLRALEEVRVQGQVLDPGGSPAPDLEGRALVQAFDSAAMSELDGIAYRQAGAPLFRGYVPVEAGRFTAAFRVPKDITYHGRLGRISAFAWPNGEVPAAFGALEGLTLAGTAARVERDDEGPRITLGFEGREPATDGSRIRPGAGLRARVEDASGINVTGETGHQIELGIDQQQVPVTDYFYAQDGYARGVLEYPMPVLEPGTHRIRLKVWDTHNNSAEAGVRVEVSRAADLLVSDLLFHPNPLGAEGGHLAFHWALSEASVRVRVYSLAGRLVDELEGAARQGPNQVAWTPDGDLANGTYLAHVEVSSPTGQRAARVLPVVLLR